MGSISSAEVQNTFKTIDKDGNGVLDVNEFKEFMFKDYPSLRSFYKLIMEIYGKNNQMSYKQFEKFLKDTKVKDKNSKKFLPKRIFKYIDVDNSKTVSGAEMKKVINLIELPPGEKFEFNDDDSYNYNEFYSLIVQVWELAWKLSDVDVQECDVQ